MMNNPKVSIIIPIYNTEHYLRQCLDSVVNQTFKDIEIICVNDYSPDNSLEIIKEYQQKDDRIVLVDLKQNKGLANARNEGIKESKGDYIAFIDSDDYVEKNYIEKLLISDADIIVCSFYKEYWFKSWKHVVTKEQKSRTKDEYIKGLLNFEKAIGCVWGKLFNANYLKEHNIMFDDDLKLAEDVEFCLRYVQYDPKITYIPNALYHYNFSSISMVRKFNKLYADSYKKSLKKMEALIDKTKYLIEWNNFVAHHLLLICVNYCFNLSNKVSYCTKKQMLKEVLKDDLFFSSINLSSLKDFPLSKRITLFCLKKNLIFLVYIISIIRNYMR